MKRLLSVFLILLSLFMAGCSTEIKEHPYDYYMDSTTQKQIEEMAEKPFIDSIFSFTLFAFQRPGNTNPTNGQFMILVAPSFDNMGSSIFSADGLVEEDRNILKNADLNPIVITQALARTEGLSLGDRLYQPTNISEEPLEFTVGAIYREKSHFAQFEAVALLNSQINKLFAERVEEMGYTNAYIKASDIEQLKNYMDNEFIPALAVIGMSEEDIALISREEACLYFEEYEVHEKRMTSN